MPLGAIGNIASGIGGALGSIFGQRSMPAVEQPQVTNISNTLETRDSGSDQPMMQANPFAAFTPQIAQGISRNLPAIGRALGIGGGAVLGANMLSPSDEVCMPEAAKPFSVSKTTGCISVTRKQQAR